MLLIFDSPITDQSQFLQQIYQPLIEQLPLKKLLKSRLADVSTCAYLGAAFTSRNDRTASDQKSRKRRAEGKENVSSKKGSQGGKQNLFKTGRNFNHHNTVSAIKEPMKKRQLYLGRLRNLVSTDDIRELCKNKSLIYFIFVKHLKKRLL